MLNLTLARKPLLPFFLLLSAGLWACPTGEVDDDDSVDDDDALDDDDAVDDDDATNTPPTADAGQDVDATVGDTVVLDASGSADVDADPLTYSWVITTAPKGSTAVLDDATLVGPSLTLDVAGVYELTVTVSDGTETADDAVTIWGCSAAVDMYPTPVSDATSPFPEVDDSMIEVPFFANFSFSFYGTDYSSVFLNTNGGMTFGVGSSDYEDDVASYPAGIGVFWTDLDAEEYGGSARANQMLYQACPHRFTVTYLQMQSNDEEDENGTAAVVLEADGTITIAYGVVSLTDVAVGVWDGTHTDNRVMPIQASYPAYSTTGTGIVLWDYETDQIDLSGELNDQILVFTP